MVSDTMESTSGGQAGDQRISRWARERRTPGSTVLPILLVMAILALLPLATASVLFAIVAIALAALIILVATLGADRASTVLLTMAFGFAPLTNFAIGPKPIVLASFMLFAAFCLALPRMIHQRLHVPAPFLVGALLFTVMGLLATPRAINAIEHLGYVINGVIALALIPMALVWMSPSTRQMWALMFSFGLGTCISTLYGLPTYTYRNPGFTYHPVALAYTAMLALSFVPYLLTLKQVRSRWLLVPPVIVIALIAVWTSGSRTSFVVLIALSVLVPLLERSIRLGLAVVTTGVVLLPVVVTADTSSNSTSALARLFGDGGASNSDTVRLITLDDGLRQILDSPLLGNGFSTEHTYVIHNIYLQVLAATGIIGLIGLLLMFGALMVPLFRTSDPRRFLAYPAVAVVLAGPFQPNMTDHYLAMSLGLCLIAAVRVRPDATDAAAAPIERAPKFTSVRSA